MQLSAGRNTFYIVSYIYYYFFFYRRLIINKLLIRIFRIAFSHITIFIGYRFRNEFSSGISFDIIS